MAVVDPKFSPNAEMKANEEISKSSKSSLVTEEIRAKAEVYHGEEMCKQKVRELLKLMDLPNGLLPLEGIEECGFVRETGFFWFKRKSKLEYNFESIGRMTSYGTEVTGIIEKHKIKKSTGIKSKELLIWITVCELSATGSSPTDKITFKTPTGFYKTFPVTAFQVPE